MSSEALAGSAGPHVFVPSTDQLVLSDDDLAHFERSLRMRDGDPCTVSDGAGSWAKAVLRAGGRVEVDGEWHTVAAPRYQVTVGFSLVKGQKPELVVQKLTEIGVDQIVGLVADRSVVRWDETKVDKALHRWRRIALEAAMQSHRVRLPKIVGVVDAKSFLSDGDSVSLAHFDGTPVDAQHRCIAIGPEGGWSDDELGLSSQRVSLGDGVLRAETAAIVAATLMTAARRST